jgi:hypothetical protein
LDFSSPEQATVEVLVSNKFVDLKDARRADFMEGFETCIIMFNDRFKQMGIFLSVGTVSKRLQIYFRPHHHNIDEVRLGPDEIPRVLEAIERICCPYDEEPNQEG